MNLGPETMMMLTCSPFIGNGKQMETWRIEEPLFVAIIFLEQQCPSHSVGLIKCQKPLMANSLVMEALNILELWKTFPFSPYKWWL